MVRMLKVDNIPYYCHIFMNKSKELASSLTTERGTPKDDRTTLKVLKDNAEELGIQVEELADGAYEFKLGDLTRRIRRGPILDLENAFTYWLCGNKYATYEILRKYGFKKVPYYRRYSLGTIREARRDFTTRKRAVVIKPCFGTSRGKGVTVDIRDVRKLNGAIYNSLMYDGTFLMEDFIEGGNFRILFYKDRMLDAFQRVPANVKGDGINNIKSLIRIENERRVKQQSPIPLYPIEIDDDVKRCLHRQDISLKSVPEKDEVVYVRTAINYRTGGEMKDVKTMVHEDIVSDCRSIMKIMDITLGGIDIITRNIDRPLAETGGAINEVNTSPGLIVHDNDVIKNILNLMFEREC